MSNKVTLDDIAKELNLAKSTVSLALANKYGISESLRSQIIIKAIEMGYDFAKLNKRHTKKTNIVCIIIDSQEMLNTPFWIEIIRSIEKYLILKKKTLKIIVYQQYHNMGEILLQIANKVEGIFLLSISKNEDVLLLKTLNIPIVLLDSRECVLTDCSQVRFSNFESGYLAASYLYDKGFRNFASLGSASFSYSFVQRLNGFSMFMDEKKVKYTPYNDDDKDDKMLGYSKDSVKEIIFKKDFPLALFCANDYVAALFYQEAIKYGVNIPKDISIVGFDNAPIEKLNLTTIDVPRDRFGRKSVELMEKLINSEEIEDSEIICVNGIIKEGSTVI